MLRTENRGIGVGSLALVLLFAPSLVAQEKVLPEDQKPVERNIFGPTLNTLDQAPNQVNGTFADSDCQACGSGAQTVIENFEVNAPGPGFRFRVDQIVIWGGYATGNTPNAMDDFTIQIRDDSAGAPGGPLISRVGIQPDSRVDTGVDVLGVDEYMFTFDLAEPLVVPNGTWWIEIFNNTATTSGVDFFWETGNLDAVHGFAGSRFATSVPGSSWPPQANEMAIQLNGVNVPVELMSFSID